MFGARFWRLVVALVALGSMIFAYRELYLAGWSHGYARARCDFSGEPCPEIDEMGRPKK